jgi:hypothetical protein
MPKKVYAKKYSPGRCKFKTFPNVTLNAIISDEGPLQWWFYTGGTNEFIFEDFIQRYRYNYTYFKPWKKHFLFVDNATSHKTKRIMQIIKNNQ